MELLVRLGQSPPCPNPSKEELGSPKIKKISGKNPSNLVATLSSLGLKPFRRCSPEIRVTVWDSFCLEKKECS